MQQLTGATICVLLLGTVTLFADQGRGNAKRSNREVRAYHETDPGGTTIHFSVEHVRVIREYYTPRYRALPPGLQKKYARTGQLPPGWQKKMEPMPVALERKLPPLPEHCHRGVIDGHAVIYDSRAGTIIDVAVLF